MTLNDLIKHLQEEAKKHGNLEVFYRHGASGDCGPVGTGHVTAEVDGCGPFDLKKNQKYFSLYVGN